VLLDSEANTKSGLSKSEDKAGDMKYSSHSLEEVAEMVHGTVSSYEVKVQNLSHVCLQKTYFFGSEILGLIAFYVLCFK